MATLDAYLKAIAAVTTAVFAVVALLGRRQAAGRALAGFLALIALNQGFETARALASDPGLKDLLFRGATVAAALDPLLLWAFVREALGEPRPRATQALLPSASGALALWPLLGLSMDASGGAIGYFAALSAYTLAVYGSLLVGVLLRRDERPAARLLAFGLCAVVLPTLPPFLETMSGLAGSADARGRALALAWRVELPVVLLVAAALLCAAALRGRGRFAATTLGSAVALTFLIDVANVPNALAALGWAAPPAASGGVEASLGRAGAALRWLVFGALASVIVLRHRGLELSAASRRLAARVLVGLALLTLGAVALTFGLALAGDAAEARPLEIALLAAVVAASQAFRSLTDRVAQRVYGLPRPADAAAARETYRLAAQQVARRGDSPADDPFLVTLRGELGIGAAEAAALERAALEREPPPVAEGSLVAGRYRVLRALGSGGGGRAFLARDEVLGRDVVIKRVLHDEGAALREAQIAGALSHPHVLVVYDAIPRPDATLLVLEHAPGGSLAEAVARHGPLPAQEGERVADGLLAALEAVHARGIVHRDVKPENVLLGEGGFPKLADFGIAAPAHGQEAGTVEGTAAYMAPEQRRGEPATPRSDLYAVGLLMERCFQRPADGRWEGVLRRALAEDPKERWESAAQMRAALRAARLTPAGGT